MRKTALFMVLLMFALAHISGCIKMGPDYARPAQKNPAGFQHADSGPGAFVDPEQWWKSLGDQKLNKLVDDALKYNPDMQKAAARVLELQAQFTEVESYLYPSLSLDGKAKRQQAVETGMSLPPQFQQERRTNSYSLSLAASYEVDLWGRIARANEAARADLLSAEENRRTLAQTLVAQVVSSYLNIEALERRLMVSDQSISAVTGSLAVVETRYFRGLTSVLDMTQARRTLARAKAAKPSLRLDLGMEQQKLAILAGRYPRTSPAQIQPLDYFPHLEPVPAGLPSGLLKRRPDLRVSEAQLMALNARVGQATAARFPTLSLTGAFGYGTDELGSLITPASELWSIAAGLVQPIFDAGRLESQQRAAEARLKQGVASYAKAVLAAFREVEAALLTRKELMERRELLREALAEGIATQETALSRYQRGLTDYLRVLDAMRTRYELEDNVVLVELALLTNRVSLHRALGGGWADPGPVTSQTKPEASPAKKDI